MKMNYFSLFLSQFIMLVINMCLICFPYAVLASAPTGTPLSLYLSTDGKKGLARRTAFLEFTAGSVAGSIGLLAFSWPRCIVLYGETLQYKLIMCSWCWLCCIFCMCLCTIKFHIFATLTNNSDTDTIPTRKRT